MIPTKVRKNEGGFYLMLFFFFHIGICRGRVGAGRGGAGRVVWGGGWLFVFFLHSIIFCLSCLLFIIALFCYCLSNCLRVAPLCVSSS